MVAKFQPKRGYPHGDPCCKLLIVMCSPLSKKEQLETMEYKYLAIKYSRVPVCTSNAYYSGVVEGECMNIRVHLLVYSILWGIVAPTYMKNAKAQYGKQEAQYGNRM